MQSQRLKLFQPTVVALAAALCCRIGAWLECSGRPRFVEPNAPRDLVGPGHGTQRLCIQNAAHLFFSPADVR